ncbi:MAG: DUF4410 domain-containing protein [Alphaproteobacteria bacterium]
MRRMYMKILGILFLTGMLSACGSTSNLRNASNSELDLNLANYRRVIVNDLTNSVTEGDKSPHIAAEGKKFADMIASEIIATKAFEKVERNVHSQEPALLIQGSIIECTEGNPALRVMVGFGAGSSCFDAKVLLKDNATKRTLGEIDVNKMSWALGGMIAGVQDVNSHMISGASSIASECARAKNRSQ